MAKFLRPPEGASVVPAAAVAATAALLSWPLLTRRGYPLSRDLVFTPDQPLRPESLGLSTAPPRAVPLDALVAVMDSVIGGEALARVAILGCLLAIGGAAARVGRGWSLPSRVLCAVLALWNPFVVERLALGQWALLWGYAGVWGVVALAWNAPRHAAAWLGPWLAVSALTPTGALLAGGAAVVLFWRAKDRAMAWTLAGVAQLPWMMPALFGGGRGVSDPAAVAAFAARSERPGGALWSLLGLGGVWDRLSVPGSRGGIAGHATSALVVVVLVVIALLAVRGRHRPPGALAPLWLLGSGGLIVAGASSSPWGRTAIEWLTANVAGAGLLRDSQKWLAWFVVACIVSAGWLTTRLLAWIDWRVPWLTTTIMVVLLALPWVLLPDATRVVWRTLTPVTYPGSFAVAAQHVRGSDRALVTLPWRSYREFSWAGPLSSSDPALRWFDAPVVTSDRLIVGSITLSGEDVRADEVEQVLSAPPDAWVQQLAALGVGFVLVYEDDPQAPQDLPGARPVMQDETMALWEVPGAVTEAGPSRTSAVLLGLADVVAALALLLAPLVAAARRRKRRTAE